MNPLIWARIAAALFFAAFGAYVAHRWDGAIIEHQKGLVTAEKLGREKDVKDALIWAADQQRKFDNAALQSAQRERDAQAQIAKSAGDRLAELRGHERDLVRGCLTYEFVRHLDAAISDRPASALPIPGGKSADACAPVDAAAVERWLLGIIANCQANAAQLDNLIAFFRDAQAKR